MTELDLNSYLLSRDTCQQVKMPHLQGNAMAITPRLALVTTAALLALAPLSAAAQDKAGLMYRCTGKDGKRYYQSTIPPACYGMKMEIINNQGNVVKRIDPDAVE